MVLEELIRAAAAGKGEALPETVLAMLQARLLRLDAGARRVLRSASIFGATFWRGGILSLCDAEYTSAEIDGWLRVLVDTELLERHRESRFPGEVEYSFRHALMCDAAYSLSAEGECKLGHYRAGTYLESRVDIPPLLIAEHFQRSGVLERAIPWFVRAAELAMSGNDLTTTLQLAERGTACGANGWALGMLRMLQAWAGWKTGEMIRRVPAAAEESLALLPAGSRGWCRSLSTLFSCSAAGVVGKISLIELWSKYMTNDPEPDALGLYIEAGASMIVGLSMVGQLQPAKMFSELLTQKAGPLSLQSDAFSRGWLSTARSCYLRYLTPELGQALHIAQDAIAAFTAAGDLRSTLYAEILRAQICDDLGDFESAIASHRRNLILAQNAGEIAITLTLKTALADSLAKQDEIAHETEVRRIIDEIIQISGGHPYDTGRARYTHAKLLAARGDLEQAEQVVRQSYAELQIMPTVQVSAAALFINILIQRGCTSEARRLAEESLERLKQIGDSTYNEIALRVAVAEARQADGDSAAARVALEDAMTHLRRRADNISDLELRQGFLNNVKENARAQFLERAWSSFQPPA